ncbi:hypothetical protein KJ693_12335 [bacterium]|nr:hypothetical protein [bacterium]MBU1616080.1 hypothetical protein [bacterium]
MKTETTRPFDKDYADLPEKIKDQADKQLLGFVGTIKSDDIRAMTQAIKDNCERIDSDE